jgi:plasmid stabilization system protein ParE
VPTLRWLPEALDDLQRLHAFLAKMSPAAAGRAAAAILDGADWLETHPHLGRPLQDGRREHFISFGVSSYVLRYRVDTGGNPVVVRVWRSREDR